MNINVLKDEIIQDPLGRGYSEMTDEEVLADLLTEYRTATRDVPNTSVFLWSASGGRLASITESSTNHESPQIRAICLAALKLLDRPEQPYKRADHLSMLAALVTGGVISQADADALDDRADATITRAEELGISVSLGVINRARG